MNYNRFSPEYEGDNPNREWVRQQLAKRGQSVDLIDIIKMLPKAQIEWLFWKVVKHSYFGIADD